MSLISKTIPGLYNGVSQQPPSLRLSTQCDLQENAYSNLVDGLTQRPPTEFISLLDSNANSDSLIHKIKRDNNEEYLVLFSYDSDEPIEIFKLDGTKCNVIYEAPRQYILTSSPKDNLRVVTVADYTFILNTKYNTARDTNYISPQSSPTGVCFIKRGVAETDYKIFVNNSQVAAYTSGNTSAAATYKTTTIASSLYNNLVSSLGTTNWNITLLDSSIILSRKDGADFDFRVSDSYGEQAMVGIKNSIQKFTDLPPKVTEGLIVEITGDESNNFDNYYVKFEDGAWKETVKPGSYIKFWPYSMPHKLVRTDVDTFTFSVIDWDEKKVGDEESAPDPSFLERPINDIFFFKNRLGFLSGDSVILSKAGDYFNFYPTTATDILDDDPIDVAVSTNQVSILKNALPSYNTNLLLDSGQQQFILSSGETILTPKTVSVDPTTSFETNTKCRPVSAGANAYFVVPNGNYSRIREYFVQPDTLINDAADITAHVPRYLPKNIIEVVSSSTNDLLLCLSSEERNKIYLYKYFWNGNEKVQSAWSTWTFDDDILGLGIFENYIYFIQEKDNQKFLSRMDLEKVANSGISFRIHLDKLVKVLGVFNPDTNKTTWTLPYSDSSTDFMIINPKGVRVGVSATKVSSTQIEATGDFSDAEYWIGKPYKMRYRFSQVVVKSDQTNTADLSIKLQLRKLILSFTNTGYFRLEVTPLRRETITQEFVGTVMGVSRIGEPSLITDERAFLVMGGADSVQIDLVSDSYLPCEFQTATFQGIAVSLSRSI